MAEMLEEESIINSILQMRLLKQKQNKTKQGLTKNARLEKKQARSQVSLRSRSKTTGLVLHFRQVAV